MNYGKVKYVFRCLDCSAFNYEDAIVSVRDISKLLDNNKICKKCNGPLFEFSYKSYDVSGNSTDKVFFDEFYKVQRKYYNENLKGNNRGIGQENIPSLGLEKSPSDKQSSSKEWVEQVTGMEFVWVPALCANVDETPTLW